MSYRLERVTPDGQTKTHEGLRSKREAASALANVLTDNLGLRRKDVEPLAFQAEYGLLGTPIQAYGYTFRVLAAV